MNNIEYRAYQLEDTFYDEESRTVKGLAIPVDSRSELLGNCFYETILRSAVNEDLIKKNDIKLYLNHDASQGTYGRSKFGKGTLKLSITERGLEFECKLGKSQRASELLEGIERGDYDAISFAMCVGKDKWDENPDGTYNRIISEIKLLDEISILSQLPAYSATEVACRSLDEFKQEQEKIKQEEAEERNKILDSKLEELDNLMIEIDYK